MSVIKWNAGKTFNKTWRLCNLLPHACWREWRNFASTTILFKQIVCFTNELLFIIWLIQKENIGGFLFYKFVTLAFIFIVAAWKVQQMYCTDNELFSNRSGFKVTHLLLWYIIKESFGCRRESYIFDILSRMALGPNTPGFSIISR